MACHPNRVSSQAAGLRRTGPAVLLALACLVPLVLLALPVVALVLLALAVLVLLALALAVVALVLLALAVLVLLALAVLALVLLALARSWPWSCWPWPVVPLVLLALVSAASSLICCGCLLGVLLGVVLLACRTRSLCGLRPGRVFDGRLSHDADASPTARCPTPCARARHLDTRARP